MTKHLVDYPDYGYSDFANEVFENVSFTAIEGEDIEPKLREALDKVMEIF